MIDFYQAVVLVLLQGLTELLPVSSAALLLFPALLLGWADHGPAFDVAAHVGTLSATLLYYGLLLGLSRQSAARFSFLLSIPIIIASAGMLKISELASGDDASVDWLSLGLGVAVPGVSAYACIAACLRLLDKVGFMPFVYYRIALALALYRLWLK